MAKIPGGMCWYKTYIKPERHDTKPIKSVHKPDQNRRETCNRLYQMYTKSYSKAYEEL